MFVIKYICRLKSHIFFYTKSLETTIQNAKVISCRNGRNFEMICNVHIYMYTYVTNPTFLLSYSFLNVCHQNIYFVIKWINVIYYYYFLAKPLTNIVETAGQKLFLLKFTALLTNTELEENLKFQGAFTAFIPIDEGFQNISYDDRYNITYLWLIYICLTLPLYYWSVCIKPEKWAVMYLCVRGHVFVC